MFHSFRNFAYVSALLLCLLACSPLLACQKNVVDAARFAGWRDFILAIHESPEDPSPCLRFADWLSANGQQDEARVFLARAQNPTDPDQWEADRSIRDIARKIRDDWGNAFPGIYGHLDFHHVLPYSLWLREYRASVAGLVHAMGVRNLLLHPFPWRNTQVKELLYSEAGRQLWALEIKGKTIRDRLFAQLPLPLSLPELKKIRLEQGLLPKSTWKTFLRSDSLPALKEFSLQWVHNQQQELTPENRSFLSQLQSLKLFASKLTANDWKELPRVDFRNLTQLSFEYAPGHPANEDIREWLPAFAQLQELSLLGAKLTPAQLEILSHAKFFSNLQTLSVEGVFAITEDVRCLLRAKSLRELNVRPFGKSLSATQLRALVEGLPELQHLILRDVESSEDAIALNRLIREHQDIEFTVYPRSSDPLSP